MFLGIDTSCYTTSLALVDAEGILIKDLRRVLKVDPARRGLMQSEALFQHIVNLPELISELKADLGGVVIQAVCYSGKPRNLNRSYMPVFLAGKLAAQSIAFGANVPFFEVSHQENHIQAGLYALDDLQEQDFVAIHFSGGTSEVLDVKRNAGGFKIKLIKGTEDLHAGQFVDRIGVRLGRDFPAGKNLEKYAMTCKHEKFPRIPTSVRENFFSFSGPESAAQRLIEKGVPAPEVARAVEHCLAKTLEKLIEQSYLETGEKNFLLVGGVTANKYIRFHLQKKFPAFAGWRVLFAQTSFASDNALGTALLGRAKYDLHRQIIVD